MNLEQIERKLNEALELLADHENTISFLLNSLPGSAMTPKEQEEVKEIPEKPWNKNQWYRVEQVLGEWENFKRKFLDLEQLVKSQSGKGDRL
jgi:hypothetical protein